jgi:hypothetical protein
MRLDSTVTSWQAASPHPRSRLVQLPLCVSHSQATRRTGSRSVSFYSACCWWAGIHLPAAAAACQSFVYDLYKKLTELSANNSRLLFCLLACWSQGWSSVAIVYCIMKDKSGGASPLASCLLLEELGAPRPTPSSQVLKEAVWSGSFYLHQPPARPPAGRASPAPTATASQLDIAAKWCYVVYKQASYK